VGAGRPALGWEADRGLADLRALAAMLAGLAASWERFLEAVEASREESSRR
jgi:hypothetical protein